MYGLNMFTLLFLRALLKNYFADVGAYGEIYLTDGTDIQAVPAGSAYTKTTVFVTNGASFNATNDVANDRIIVGKSGMYSISFSFSTKVLINDVELRTAVFVDGAEVSNIHSLRATKASSYSVSAASGFCRLTAGQEVDIRARHDHISDTDIQVAYANLNIEYVGK